MCKFVSENCTLRSQGTAFTSLEDEKLRFLWNGSMKYLVIWLVCFSFYPNSMGMWSGRYWLTYMPSVSVARRGTFCNFLVTKSRLGIVEHMSHSLFLQLPIVWQNRGVIGAAKYASSCTWLDPQFTDNSHWCLSWYLRKTVCWAIWSILLSFLVL